jgi:hypothetical protein
VPKPRQNYAIIEWTFLRFDPRYRALADDEAKAYLHLWALCLQLRRDRFGKDEIVSPMLIDFTGVNSQSYHRMLASALGSGLLSKGAGGVVSVEGIRAKHPGIRRWNDQGINTLCGADSQQALSETGEERK